MRLHRFYVNKPLGEELVVESFSSEKEILHQWQRVFRYREGDEVILFGDSRPGTDFLYRIQTLTKENAHLVPISTSSNFLPARELTLVVALVKKDTFETIVRQATELGVSRIVPLLADRSEKKSINMERLIAISKEAVEQCGRGTLPEIAPISTKEEIAARDIGISYVGSLHGGTFTPTDSKAALWIGPEGGWTEEEEAFFRDTGFHLIRFAQTTLRADTAATAFLSLFQ